MNVKVFATTPSYCFAEFKDHLVHQLKDPQSALAVQVSTISQSNSKEVMLHFHDAGEARRVYGNYAILQSALREWMKLYPKFPITKLHLAWEGCKRPLTVLAAHITTLILPQASIEQSSESLITTPSDIGSYGASKLSYHASPEAIADFIRGKEKEGYVVTITSLLTFMPLYLNQKQVEDRAARSGRGKRWTGDDWMRQGFMHLWRDSFKGNGAFNYFAQLYQLCTEGSGDYRQFTYDYNIRRPSGALARYQTLYVPIENYLGFADSPVPARIGISRVGDWEIIEDAPDSSEVVKP
jgi:hypothetical protein